MDKVGFYFLLNRVSFWAALIGMVVLAIGLLSYIIANGHYMILAGGVFVAMMAILHVVTSRRIIELHGEYS